MLSMLVLLATSSNDTIQQNALLYLLASSKYIHQILQDRYLPRPLSRLVLLAPLSLKETTPGFLISTKIM